MISSFSQTIEYVDDDAQDRDSTEAEALPWFGNNQYLNNLLDSIGYNNGVTNRIITSDIAKYKVPIKFWVYRRSNGTGGPVLAQLRNYIDNLNRVFTVDNRTLIGFYLRCDIGFINSDDNFDIGGDGEAWNLIQNNKSQGCINIHIVGDYTDVAGIHIRSRFFGRDGIVLNFSATNGGANTTIAHEVGHYFELDHTHQYSSRGKCRKEPVDRNRTWPFFGFCPFGGGGPTNQKICEATGDFLGDTPADPDLTNNLFNTFGACSFNATGNYNNTADPWGDCYTNPPAGASQPNPRNVMSYNRDRDCKINFSRLQIAVMLYSIERGKSQSNCAAWKDLKGEYDDLEMDNFSEVARQINTGIIQEHNFHQQYEGNGTWTQCDVDWVRFVPNCTATLSVSTSAITNRTNANTRLTLFSNTLVQLAQNDNISATNLFSSVSFNFITGQEYLIRIENMQNLVTSYYNLLVGSANSTNLNGDNFFCNTSNLYSVANLPAGASVQWTATPIGLATINTPNATQTTLTKNGDGVLTLAARVTPICGTPYNVERTNITSGRGASSLNFTRMVANCDAGPYLYAAYTPIPTATNCSWYKKDMTLASNPFVFLEDALDGTDYPLRRGNRYYTIRAVVTTPCGNITSDAVVFAPNCTGARLMLSPNPVTNTLNLSTIEDKETFKTGENNIQEVVITDKMGIVVFQKKYAVGTKKITMPVNNLKSELYFIKTWDGKTWETLQFIKN